jgi:hypothetical protein
VYLCCSAICDNISVKGGLGGGGVWSDPSTFGDQLSGGGEGEPATGIDPTVNRDPVGTVGNSGLGGTWSDHNNDPGLSGVGRGLLMYAICDHISSESGLGGSVCSEPGMFVGLSSHRPRFCDAAVTSLVTFAPRGTSGLSRAATGAASAKLMVERMRRVRMSILCCRIFVGSVR